MKIPPIIIGFSQYSSVLEIIFKNRPKEVNCAFYDTVPTELNSHKLYEMGNRELGCGCLQGRNSNITNLIEQKFDTESEKLTIRLTGEPTGRSYSIVIFIDNHWFELVRQSEAWLRQEFNFDRSGGYTMLGRRSFHVGNKKIALQAGSLIFYKRPNLTGIEKYGNSKYPEVKAAGGVLKYLLKQHILIGPTNADYSVFLRKSLDEKLFLLNNEKFSVSCSGFRDLFLHASEGVVSFKARGLDIFNYSPQFRDLISYSHSTAEIWIECLNKWVLFDPWLGGLMTFLDGRPCGSNEVQDHIKEPTKFELAPVIDLIPRITKGLDGSIKQADFRPSKVHTEKYLFTNDGYTPGYISYFHSVRVLEHVVYRFS